MSVSLIECKFSVDSKISEITSKAICFENGWELRDISTKNYVANVYADFKSLLDQHLVGKEVKCLTLRLCRGGVIIGFDSTEIQVNCYCVHKGDFHIICELAMVNMYQYVLTEFSINTISVEV